MFFSAKQFSSSNQFSLCPIALSLPTYLSPLVLALLFSEFLPAAGVLLRLPLTFTGVNCLGTGNMLLRRVFTIAVPGLGGLCAEGLGLFVGVTGELIAGLLCLLDEDGGVPLALGGCLTLGLERGRTVVD